MVRFLPASARSRSATDHEGEIGRPVYSASKHMRRSIFFLMLGIFCTALIGSAISVFLFHDVDQDKIGHWNEALAGLCTESVLFTLIICGAVGLLTWLGRRLFRLKAYSPRAMLGLFLGIGLTTFQYLWDFAVRRKLPKFANFSLAVYLAVAIVFCTAALLRDNFNQKKSSAAHEALSPV